jgi:hypothetical protein
MAVFLYFLKFVVMMHGDHPVLRFSQIWLQMRSENKWSESILLLLLLATNVRGPNLDIWQIPTIFLKIKIWQLRTWDFFQFGEVQKLAIIFQKKKRKFLWNYTEKKDLSHFLFPKNSHRMLLFSFFYCRFAKNKNTGTEVLLAMSTYSFLKNSGLPGSKGPFLLGTS